jgi:hypothetical protein
MFAAGHYNQFFSIKFVENDLAVENYLAVWLKII